MSTTDATLWGLALLLGFVALLAVVALLEEFHTQVRRIERAAEAVWDAGKRLAANTATTWMLVGTCNRLSLLAQETRRHTHLARRAWPPEEAG